MITVAVPLGDYSYDVLVAQRDVKNLTSFVEDRARGEQAFIITDQNVAQHLPLVEQALQDAGLVVCSQTISAGEAQKSLTCAEELYDWLAENRADRKSLMVALGGGVVGDLTGFIAATYNRGLDLLMLPTTLLAMVDSSVGGKVGINHPKGKNLIGAFHQPVGVWIDVSMLETLPEREYRSGLAEVVKYGVILDEQFFAYLEQHVDELLTRDPETVQYIVAHSCRLKAQVVSQDERELLGLRVILNYGHTFAHAFEAVAGYGTWLHGEAVAAGMICGSRLAEKHGLIPDEVTARQLALLEKLGLPVSIPEGWSVEDMLQVMRRDKKNVAGRMRFVLPTRIGEVALFDDVAEETVVSVLTMTGERGA